MECDIKTNETIKKDVWKLMLENARISLWLLIIITGVLGMMGKINPQDLPYLIGFLGFIAVGGESAIELIAQRFHINNRIQKQFVENEKLTFLADKLAKNISKGE